MEIMYSRDSKIRKDNINNEVERIYDQNVELFNHIANNKIKESISKLNKFFTLSDETKYELKVLINRQIEEKVKMKIKHKLIIEKLYPSEMKEEALRKLPLCIRELG